MKAPSAAKVRKERNKELAFRRREGMLFDIAHTGDVIDDVTWGVLDSLAPRRRVLLWYSTGKDSVAAWWALKQRGYTVVPVLRQLLPGLSFFDAPLKAHEEFFGQEVTVIPHQSVLLAERAQSFHDDFDSINLSDASKDLINGASTSKASQVRIREHTNDALIDEFDCDVSIVGTKASDSLHRRTHFKVDGPYTAKERLFALNWRLQKNAPFRIMIDNKIPIPRYYVWLGRSPELHLDYEFYFIKKYHPEDYERIVSYLPGVDACVKKHEFAPTGERLLHMTRMPKFVVDAFEAGHPFV